MKLLLPDGVEIKEFKPCVFSHDEMQITTCLFEDASYVAVPFYNDENGNPICHYVDQLLANDDRRVVGMQVWIGNKVPKKYGERMLEEAEAEYKRERWFQRVKFITLLIVIAVGLKYLFT